MSTLILPRPSTQPDLYFGKYVAGLYAQDRRGLWDDPSNLSTLFQDAAGITPITAPGQPVGLILDKSRGLRLGPNLSSNPTYETGLGNTTFGNSGLVYWDEVNKRAIFRRQAGEFAQILIRNIVSEPQIGRFYEISVDITNVSCTQGNIGLQSNLTQSSYTQFLNASSWVGQTRSYRIILPSERISGNYWLFVQLNGVNVGGEIAVDNISCREVAGSHAYQFASVSRPLLRQDATGTVNFQYDGIDDFHVLAAGGGAAAEFFFCAAIQVGRVGSVQTLYSNASSNSGYRVRVNAANQLEFSAGNGSGFTTVATTDAMVIDQRAVLTAWSDGARLYAQINNGPVSQQVSGSVATGTASATIGRDNGSATSYFMGRIYGLVTCHSQVDATHRSSVQQYLNFKIGGLL